MELRARAGDLVTGQQMQQPCAAGGEFGLLGVRLFGDCSDALAPVGAGFGGIGGDVAKAAGEESNAVPDGHFEERIEAAQKALVGGDLAQHHEDHGEAIGQGQSGGVSYSGHTLTLHKDGGVRKEKNGWRPK